MSMLPVYIAARAEADIEQAFAWWRDNRSKEEASRWLDGVYPAIDSLSRMPERCARVTEVRQPRENLRQLLFGIGRKPTHRVIFRVLSDRVEVLRVLHVSRPPINLKDLS
jgi:plasmid stabilization system protein ParE